MIVLVCIAWALTFLIWVAILYRAIFAAAYLLADSGHTSRVPSRQRRFAVVIPAHDEELLIQDVIRSIRGVDYPRELIEIHVIADNCLDRTAELAREAGASVEERNAPDHRGKGQALQWMFERIDISEVDAVVLLDADNRVEPAFFLAMNRELDQGARCLQGYYGISNPGESVMTRLLAVTYVMKNLLFNAGKANLGLSVVLAGTGMVFTRDVIRKFGWEAMSIGEDLEQTFNLLEAGEHIRFVADARTQAQEASNLRQGYTQRQRWATGRRVLSARARRAIATGIGQRNIHLADTGLDLLMPSYAKLMNWTAVGLVMSVLLHPWAEWLLPALLAALAYQILEVLLGLRVMRAEPAFVLSLAFAPVFLMWKAVVDLLALMGYRQQAWTRTARAPHSSSDLGGNELQNDKASHEAAEEEAKA